MENHEAAIRALRGQLSRVEKIILDEDDRHKHAVKRLNSDMEYETTRHQRVRNPLQKEKEGFENLIYFLESNVLVSTPTVSEPTVSEPTEQNRISVEVKTDPLLPPSTEKFLSLGDLVVLIDHHCSVVGGNDSTVHLQWTDIWQNVHTFVVPRSHIKWDGIRWSTGTYSYSYPGIPDTVTSSTPQKSSGSKSRSVRPNARKEDAQFREWVQNTPPGTEFSLKDGLEWFHKHRNPLIQKAADLAIKNPAVRGSLLPILKPEDTESVRTMVSHQFSSIVKSNPTILERTRRGHYKRTSA